LWCSSREKKMYRPLSPHLLIYKPQFSSVFSIFHRVTGVMLVLGLTYIWLWLCFTFLSPLRAHYSVYLISCYLNTYLAWASVAALSLVLLGLPCHTAGGVRHLIWDFYGSQFLNKATVIKSAYLILTISLIAFLTIIVRL